MIKMCYGTLDQVKFRDLNEYYFALGFLANSRNAEIHWENNEDQGAWGSEGRIHCLVPQSQFPQFFRFTAGRGNVYARINCNEYVGTLVMEHNFNYNSHSQDVAKILETVPEKYRPIFKQGFGGNLDINPEYKMPSVREPTSAKATPKTVARSKTISTQPKIVVAVPAEPVRPAPPPVPVKPAPIPVSVGEKIKHKAFGVGTVSAVDTNRVWIRFEKVGEKFFVNPDAFKSGFLTKM